MKWITINGHHEIDKEFYGKITDEVIDLLRKKHHLDPMECQFVLDNLSMSLTQTIREFQIFEDSS